MCRMVSYVAEHQCPSRYYVFENSIHNKHKLCTTLRAQIGLYSTAIYKQQAENIKA